MMHGLFCIAALVIIFTLILSKKAQKEIVAFALFIRTAIMVIVGGSIVLFLLYQYINWSYKINHTIFIGDPNKGIFNQ